MMTKDQAKEFEQAYTEWQANESIPDVDGTGKKYYCRWNGDTWIFTALEPQFATDEWWEISVAEEMALQLT